MIPYLLILAQKQTNTQYSVRVEQKIKQSQSDTNDTKYYVFHVDLQIMAVTREEPHHVPLPYI